MFFPSPKVHPQFFLGKFSGEMAARLDTTARAVLSVLSVLFHPAHFTLARIFLIHKGNVS
jgi:hypothetical protein